MALLQRLFRSVEKLPAARKLEKLLDQLRAVLQVLMATLVVMLITLVIISTYFLIQLLQEIF